MPPFGTYTDADVAAQVMAKDAKTWTRDSTPLARVDEITRYWKVDNALKERVRVFLDLYGDGDHYVAPVPPATQAAPCHAIESPLVDQGVSVPGLWRIVRNYEDPNQFPGCMVQTLRRGYITSLVSGAAGSEVVNWFEARIPALETGSLLPAPAGAGAGVTYRRRVVTITWICVDPTQRRAIVESLMALSSTHAAWQNATIRGEALGSGWIRLGASDSISDDGAAIVQIVLAQAPAAIEGYSSVGTSREMRESIVHGVPADMVPAFLAGFQKYGAASTPGAVPRGGSASGSLDLASGQATLQFSWRPTSPANGAVVIAVYSNPNVWQLHFIAWNQSLANLSKYIGANPVNFVAADQTALGGATDWLNFGTVITTPASGSTPAVTGPAVTAAMVSAGDWGLIGFDYDETTDLVQWHVVYRPVAESNYNLQVSYTSKWFTRRMWDNVNFVWVPQMMGVQYGHQMQVFTNFSDAWAFRQTSQLGETPYPRLIGNQWLAQRDFIQCNTGWCTTTVSEGQYGTWVMPTVYDTARFGTIPSPNPPTNPSGGTVVTVDDTD